MRKKRNYNWIYIFIILITIFVICTYVIFSATTSNSIRNQPTSFPDQISNQETLSSAPNLSTINDPALPQTQLNSAVPININKDTGWNIYENKQAGIYFEYPQNVEIIKHSGNNDLNLNIQIEGKANKDLYYEAGYDDVMVNVMDKYLSIDFRSQPIRENEDPIIRISKEICNDTARASGSTSGISECVKKTQAQFTDFTLGEIKGFKGEVIPWESTATLIIFQKDDKIYEVWLWGAEGAGQGASAWEESKNILKTFRFI